MPLPAALSHPPPLSLSPTSEQRPTPARTHFAPPPTATPLVLQTDCLLYEWSVEEMDQMATRCSPAVSAYWRNFLLCQVRGCPPHATAP